MPRPSSSSSSSTSVPRSNRFCICGAALLLLSSQLLGSVVAQTQAQPNPCIRWAHSATLGASQGAGNSSSTTSTLYLAGGDAKTVAGQTANTRTNALVSLDLSSNWSIASPPFKLVQADNGNPYNPPQTSLGAMFPSGDGTDLYYYGGYFSDNPTVAPNAEQLYRYNLPSSQWAAVNAGGDTITRVAEGASAVSPPTGAGDPSFFFFGGHIDAYTTQGWSVQTPRVYLSSMIEYDQGTSSWLNRTSYSSTGSVSSNSTVESVPLLRADNTLTYVPGLGTNKQGILVSIGGGNADQLLDNSILDVYDLGAQGWSKQATQGQTIGPRVGHCAVRGSAKVNGVLQHQIFIYGGQASNRTTQILNGQNSDLYILSIPSFTWTFVGNSLPSQPTGRAAHTCTLIGSQMVVVGGYVSEDLICEQPGVYVLDTSSVSWVTQYNSNTTYTTPNHPEVLAVTGGRGTGSSTSGSGYAIGTGANDTDTSSTFPKSGGSTSDPSSGGSKKGSSTGAIVGGVVGGLLAALIIAGLIWFFLRRKRRQQKEERDMQEKEKRGLQAPSGSPGSGSNLSGNPYDAAAMDDVEEQTAGYNAQFSHLVPRQTLRVVNE